MLSLAVLQITVKILIWGLFIKLHNIKKATKKNLNWVFEVFKGFFKGKNPGF